VVFACSFPVEVKEIEKFYQHLGTSKDNRHYYAPKDYLAEFFKINKEKGGTETFLKELEIGQLNTEDVISAWLGISKGAIVHMTLDEMNTFVELVNASGEEDVFLNLMNAAEGSISLGQNLFLNSLIEIVRRFRDGA
jgi:hypothetical protein